MMNLEDKPNTAIWVAVITGIFAVCAAMIPIAQIIIEKKWDRNTWSTPTVDVNIMVSQMLTSSAVAVVLNRPTLFPQPSTEIPPTAIPPSAIPPTPIPSIFIPPTAIPPTAIPPTATPLPHTLGEWTNEDANTSGITRLTIHYDGNNYSVETWGKCHPSDCYWNNYEGVRYYVSNPADSKVTIVWIFSFVENTLDVEVLPDSRLMVVSHEHFTDNSGRADSEYTYYFTKTGQ